AEVEVPGIEVLVDVREVHVRAAAEVATRRGDEAERLEVGDPRWPEICPQRRREAEEELRRLGNQVGAGDACRQRHLLRQAAPAVEAPTRKAAPDRRQPE